MRATFTQENVDAMKEFDLELARKAQIALDNQLPVNFVQMDTIEQDLPRLLEEKKQLNTARADVLKLPSGKHDLANAKLDACYPSPKDYKAFPIKDAPKKVEAPKATPPKAEPPKEKKAE